MNTGATTTRSRQAPQPGHSAGYSARFAPQQATSSATTPATKTEISDNNVTLGDNFDAQTVTTIAPNQTEKPSSPRERGDNYLAQSHRDRSGACDACGMCVLIE